MRPSVAIHEAGDNSVKMFRFGRSVALWNGLSKSSFEVSGESFLVTTREGDLYVRFHPFGMTSLGVAAYSLSQN